VETISQEESLGIGQGYRPQGRGRTPPFTTAPPNLSQRLDLDLHQGGIVETEKGEWWGFSMQDHNSVGRLTSLSPVTWQNGWPYFGLPGNLRRTPSIWVKPDTGHVEPISSPYDRGDDFSGPKLGMVWQWNHVPDDTKWSLTERPGCLRLHSLPQPISGTREIRSRSGPSDPSRKPPGISMPSGYRTATWPGWRC
jgi:beta-xylosidase